MKCLKNLSIFVVLILVGSIQLAPVEDAKKVYDLIKSDKRFEKLTFIRECESENKPICSALLDIALRFNETKLEFAKDETSKQEGDFCQSQLLKVLPEAPASQSTAPLLKSYNTVWFKDTLKADEETCNRECTHLDYEDYSQKVKRVCFFVYDQYKLLAAHNIAQIGSVKSDSANNASSMGEQQPKAAAAVTNDTKATLPQAPQQQQTSVIFESEAGGGVIDVVPANKEVKSTAPTVPVNKSESELPAQSAEQRPQDSVPDSKQPETSVKEVPLGPEKTDSSSPAPATSNKSEVTLGKEETKTSVDLESNLDDHGVFDNDGETQQPDKEQEINLDMAGDLGDDDEDEAYPDSFARDNNRIDANQKTPQEQLNDIEGPDDSVPHVQSVQFQEDPDSNFFTYLCITMFVSILLYVLYHNRQKLLALVLEGRRGSRRSRERSRGGSKAAYSKLDCNLEEAITSKKSLSGKSMDIIY